MAPQGISRDKAAEPATAPWLEQLRRGGLELAILLALTPGPRYGLEIIRHLDAFTSLVVTEGTIYPILARLTRDGLLAAQWNASDSTHPRKYYQLTAAGLARLREMVGEWRTFSGKIERLVGAAGKEIGDDAQ
jgi:PadR family transcriptional regulator, regulatory protein PadR